MYFIVHRLQIQHHKLFSFFNIECLYIFISFSFFSRFRDISFPRTCFVETSDSTAEQILKDAGLKDYVVQNGKVNITSKTLHKLKFKTSILTNTRTYSAWSLMTCKTLLILRVINRVLGNLRA